MESPFQGIGRSLKREFVSESVLLVDLKLPSAYTHSMNRPLKDKTGQEKISDKKTKKLTVGKQFILQCG